MSSPILQMQGIGKRFPGVIALEGVDLAVAAGEIVAVIGENGAGKSTLMKIIGGVQPPDSGQMLVDGKPVQFHNVNDSMACGIAFIHQELNVLDNLDVASNVFLGREPTVGGPLRLINRGLLHSQTQKYLDRLGLKISPSLPLSKLSIAEQQMVEIAKALSLNARIVIMDEPTSSLTLSETDRLLQVTKELRDNGVGVLYISHRLGEITDIADRVVALRDGHNAGNLVREEISHDRMVSLMVGRELDRTRAPHSEAIDPNYVQVEGLRTARYPDKEISFTVGSGEILGFAGLVGAGRTEVAQAIFGVEPSHAGMVTVGEAKIGRIHSPRQAIAHGIYLIPEDRRQFGLVLDWPIRENISLPALSRDSTGGLVDRWRETTIADEQVRSLSVKTPSIEVMAGNLSGGNQQKVVLAKWLSLQPKFLIFDEPTRGIDVGAKTEIYRLMRVLADSGVAVMMISSDMEEVLGVSDRIAVMCEGSITGILNREQANEEAVMQLAVARVTRQSTLVAE